jgi:hypothetical protein
MLEENLPHLRVVTAAPIGDQPRGTSGRERSQAGKKLASSGLKLGGQVLSPVGALLVGLLEFSGAAYRYFETFTQSHEQLEPTLLMDELLRLAAAEEPGRPLICLVDGADQLGGHWWLNLQLLFASEIREERPLVLVLAVEAERELGVEPVAGESNACSVGRSLVNRKLAQWVPLSPLTPAEATSWLGPAKSGLIKAAMELSGGRGGDLAQLWADWRERKLLHWSEEGRWEPTAHWEEVETDSRRVLGRRIFERLGADNAELTEKARLALACAALQGQAFVAEGVAEALGWEREETIDLLDLLVDDERPERALLEELEAIEIRDVQLSSSRFLCRYRFLRGTDRQAARSNVTDEERAEMARLLVTSLESIFATELHQVAHVLAAICRSAGDAATAARYEARAFGPSRAVQRGLARRLLEADVSGWSIWDFRDAAWQLRNASVALTVSDVPSEVLTYAEKAQVFARLANPIGRGLEADALTKQAHLLNIMGEVDAARLRLQTAVRLVEHGRPHVLAVALKELAALEIDLTEDLDAIARMAERAAGLFRREQNFTQLGSCTMLLSRVARLEGDSLKAKTLAETALKQAEKGGEEGLVGIALYHLGILELAADQIDAAREYAAAALAIKRRLGEHRDIATCLTLLAETEIERRRYETAWKEAEAALKLHLEFEFPRGAANCCRVMAVAAREMGSEDEARQAFQRGADFYDEIGWHEKAREMRRYA